MSSMQVGCASRHVVQDSPWATHSPVGQSPSWKQSPVESESPVIPVIVSGSIAPLEVTAAPDVVVLVVGAFGAVVGAVAVDPPVVGASGPVVAAVASSLPFLSGPQPSSPIQVARMPAKRTRHFGMYI